MNLPALSILNNNFVKDLTFLNQMFIERKQGNIYDLLGQVIFDNPLNKNFNIINEYINSFQNKKAKLTDNDRIRIQGILLYTTSYISVNNFLASLLKDKKNVRMNDIIIYLVHERYKEYLPLFSKTEYKNNYSGLIIDLIQDILKCTEVKKLNSLEIEINNLVPNFVRKIIETKQITKEDDFSFASFSIRTQTTTKLFRGLFDVVRQKEAKPKNNNAQTDQPHNVIDTENITFDTNSPKQGPILTKEIPKDGPPKDWKKNKKST